MVTSVTFSPAGDVPASIAVLQWVSLWGRLIPCGSGWTLGSVHVSAELVGSLEEQGLLFAGEDEMLLSVEGEEFLRQTFSEAVGFARRAIERSEGPDVEPYPVPLGQAGDAADQD